MKGILHDFLSVPDRRDKLFPFAPERMRFGYEYLGDVPSSSPEWDEIESKLLQANMIYNNGAILIFSP
jgi:hypothetical protein